MQLNSKIILVDNAGYASDVVKKKIFSGLTEENMQLCDVMAV